MDFASEPATVKEASVLADPPPNFGKLLRNRREEAGLSLVALAKKAGLARSTIVNLEHGLTAPSPQTLRRLVSVKALRFGELAKSDDAPRIEAWFCEAYNPMAMNHAMVRTLNGPGGQIEQSYLYIDPQSACDWYALSNNEQYVSAYRSQLPLAKIAERIIKESKGIGIDVDGLGCGDGKTETELMQRLADLVPSPPDLQLYLLDISHVLLSEGYRTALNALAPRRIPVFAIHGDFNDIARNPLLYLHPESIKRLRLFLMMGATFGNIRDEPWFFRDLAACAQTGDLAVLDCGLARGSIDDPEEIRKIDPAIKARRPAEIYHRFLSGPLLRHIQGCKSVTLRTELSTHCPVPGSYSIENWATVEKEYEPDRQFLVWRVKRYDPDKLSQCLNSLGWKTLQTWKYGPDKLAAVLLVQKQ
ncbi:MAG: helix-turn-helix transcriptional regulator [Polyangia bacterium]